MIREQTVAVWQNRVRMRVLSDGSGPPLVFLHAAWGLTWDSFLGALAQHFTVHAPAHPGTTPDAHDDIHHLDGLWDLVLCYDELLSALKLDRAVVVGHSFGGMVACELAAAYPERAHRLVLIDPLGFWRDDARVVNWAMLSPAALPGAIFSNPQGEAARGLFGPTEPPEAAGAARVRIMWAMGTTGKFIWPLPDKGLKKRIHRVKAAALVIWGTDDQLVPPLYAEEFTTRLPGARVQTIDGAGHAPHLDDPATVARLVREFAGG